MQNHTVCLQGIRRPNGTLLSDEILQMFFENPRYGGAIKSVDVDYSRNHAQIIFEAASVAAKVLGTKNFNLMECSLTAVSHFTNEDSNMGSHSSAETPETPNISAEPMPTVTDDHSRAVGSPYACQNVPTSVMIENVPKTFDKENLEVLIDHPKRGINLEGSILSIDINSKTSVATVMFSLKSDAESFLDKRHLEYKQQKMPIRQPNYTLPSAVLVTGISSKADQEMLEIYFSNPKKSGGDQIAEIKYFEPHHGFAVIIYTHQQAAEAVIRKKIHNFEKRNVVATPWLPGEEMELRISSPPRTFAASETQFRGPKRETLSYENVEDAAKNINPIYEENKRFLSELSTTIDERVQDENNEDKYNIENNVAHEYKKIDAEEREANQEVKSCTILVEGLPPNTREETVRRFFQSTPRSGGGPVEYTSKVDNGDFVVIFRNSNCVDRVLRQSNLMLDCNPITVREMKPTEISSGNIEGPAEPQMVYVACDLTKLSRDALILYLEEVSESTIIKIVYGRQGVALVTFKESFDYESLRKKVYRKPVENMMLGLGRVERAKSIQVHSSKPMSEFLLKMYFENEEYSGGSGVVSIDTMGIVYIIHFSNADVAQRVAGRQHRIDEQEVDVSLFYCNLGTILPGSDTSKPHMKIPLHKTIAIDPMVLKYLKASDDAIKKWNNDLKPLSGKIDLSHPKGDEVKVICELKDHTENVRTLINDWKDKVSIQAENLIAGYTNSAIPCPSEQWQECLNDLQGYEKNNDKDVLIDYDQNSHLVVIAGPVSSQQKVVNDVEQIFQKVREMHDLTEEVVEVPLRKLAVLLKMNIDKDIKTKWPKMSMSVNEDASRGRLVLNGPTKDILQSVNHIRKLTQSILELEVPMSKPQIEVILSTHGWKHIQSLLDVNELIVDIHFNADSLTITGPKDNTTGAKTLITEEVKQCEIPISKEHRNVIQGSEWENFCHNHLKCNGGMFVSSDDLSFVKLFAIVDQINAFKDRFQIYLEMNTVQQQLVPVKLDIVELITRHSEEDLNKIMNDLINFKVKILAKKVEPGNQQSGFLVSGLIEGFYQAVAKVNDLVASVMSDSMPLIQTGQPELLKLDKTRYFLNGVEKEHEVVIEVKNLPGKLNSLITTVAETEGKRQEQVLEAFRIAQVSIKVIVGNITEHKVDAVVCPSDESMKLEGGIAEAIVQKGGESIRRECNDYILSNGNLQIGNAMMTTAGNLPCKKIIHTHGPRWIGGQQGEEDGIYDCISKCLELVDEEGMNSIAIPTLQTGKRDVPVNAATRSIVEALYDFVHRGSQIKEIHLIDEDKSNGEKFVAALKSKLGITGSSDSAKYEKKRNFPDTQTGSIVGKVDSSSLVTLEGITINIVQDKIAKKKTSAIVNSVGSDANLSFGALSSSIISAMDDVSKKLVQAEADKKKGGGLAPGKFISTSAGNLPFKMIYHFVLPTWQNNTATLQVLQNALLDVLSDCHKRGFTSLAIPALGTGRLQWPAADVAKTFFDAVLKFSKKEAKTKLKSIFFVIFPSDTNSWSGFCACLKKFQNYSFMGTDSERKLDLHQDLLEDYLGPVRRVADRTVKKFGRVTVQVTVGNITQETTDAIVNNTNSQLDLSRGAVSQALSKAGGSQFQAECQKLGGIKASNVVVTGAGNMKSKHVIHFDSWSKTQKIRKMVNACLQKADQLKLQSVTFPALGTGQLKQKPEDMASYLMEGISDFANGGYKNVDLVRIVIYQEELLKPYIDKMQELSSAKSSLLGKFSKLFGKIKYPMVSDASKLHTENSYDNLVIYALHKGNIEKAKTAIIKYFADEKANQIIGGVKEPELKEIIKQLEDDQVDWIESKGGKGGVSVTVDANRKMAQICIQGPHKDAYQIESEIRDFLHRIEKTEQKNEEAQLFCQYVQWEYEDKPGVFKPYSEKINGALERANMQNKNIITLCENDHESVDIDLIKLKESDGRKIRRRDLAKDFLPEHWTQLRQDKKCERVRLAPTDDHYIKIAQEFHQTLPKVTIIQIERLENPMLYRRYYMHKMDMEKERQNTSFEQLLWHATSITAVGNINNNNFNRNYCGTAYGTWFGKGVYFARDAVYSNKFAKADDNGYKYMYYANVLTGVYCKGNDQMIEPPAIDPTKPDILYDSSVDDMTNPGQFVVYRDTQMYPHYLVTYK